MTTYNDSRVQNALRDTVDFIAETWAEILAVLLVVVILGGIGVLAFFGIQNAINAPSSGIIHGMSYTPATDVPVTVCYSYNANGTCAVSGIQIQHYPASWSLDLYNENGKHGWVSVTEETFETHQRGDFIDLGN